MEITLEQVELIKDRTGVSYKEAKEALEAADGNVVDAIISIEETIDMSSQSRFTEQGAQVMEKVKEIVKKGNVARIVVKRNDEVMVNLPGTIAAAGTVIAPLAAIAGAIAAFGTKCTIEVVKDDGDVININQKAEGAFNDVVAKSSDFAGSVKEKGSTVVDSVKTKTQDAIDKSRKSGRAKADEAKDTVDEMWEEQRAKVNSAKAAGEEAEEAAKGEPEEESDKN